MATYAYVDNWLTRDGERVLFCDCGDQEKMEAMVAEYQANEDATPTDLIIAPPDPSAPLKAAEAYITASLSTAQLLMCLLWWGALPHEATPKLAAVCEWVITVSSTAAAGSTTFPLCPASFVEITAECAPLIAQQ